MAFTAIFYAFSKRINSTKQPSSGTSIDIILKDGCTVINPEIQLQLAADTSPAGWNYCYIASFNRYYWITNWRWEGRLWTAQCTVDALASFKTQIGSSNCYVARSASSYNLKVVDNFYPCIADVTESVGTTSQDPSWTTDINSGTFVIGVMGKNAGQNGGAVTYYAVKPAAVTAITNYLMDPQNLGVTDISDELLMCIFNPMQYIVSCLWFPFSMVTSSDPIEVGWWQITGVGNNSKVLSDALYTRNLSFTIPKHPQASRGTYLNLAPYSRYELNCGPWGVIPLDNVNLLEISTLNCWINVDLFTGSGRLSIVGQQNAVYVEDHMAQVGVPIQLGQNMLNQGAITGATGGFINTIKSAATGDVAGMLSNGLTAIGDAAAASQPINSSVGSNGSLAFNTTFKLIGRFLDIANEDIASRGRPLCQAKTINSLSGYIQCHDADPSISCSDGELKEIVSYMNGGFFYE